MCQDGSRLLRQQGLHQQHSLNGSGSSKYRHKFSISSPSLVSIATQHSPPARTPPLQRSRSISDRAPTLNNDLDSLDPNITVAAAIKPPTVTRASSITYQLPLPSGHRPQRSLPVSISTPPPSSPPSPLAPTTLTKHISLPCIFCFHGRKACTECFGLGYVQRVCQECLRVQHRLNNNRKASLPISLNQLGTKVKEQLSHISTSPSLSAVSGSSSSSSSVSSSKQQQATDLGAASKNSPRHQHQHQQQRLRLQLRSKSMVSLPTTNTFSSPLSPTTLGPVSEAIEDEEDSPSGSPMSFMGDDDDTNTSTVGREPTATSADRNIGGTVGNSNGGKGNKKSLKAAIRDALRMPKLFQGNRTTVGHERGIVSDNDQIRRRPWSMRSHSMTNLHSAPTAA
ncbi:hypothetical protein BGZ98_009280 [Dissophora globulifera]|nr:hypothetical protein BGZ98_009280 [Dissophora globulifera]